MVPCRRSSRRYGRAGRAISTRSRPSRKPPAASSRSSRWCSSCTALLVPDLFEELVEPRIVLLQLDADKRVIVVGAEKRLACFREVFAFVVDRVGTLRLAIVAQH